MLPVGIRKERALNHRISSIELSQLRALIADDAFAATFQTMGQYRTALLKAIADLGAPADAQVRSSEEVIEDAAERAHRLYWMPAFTSAEWAEVKESSKEKWRSIARTILAQARTAENDQAVVTDHSVDANKMVEEPAGQRADEPGTLAELTWCIEHGCHGPRTYRALVNAREQLLASRKFLGVPLEIHPTSAHGANAGDNDSCSPPAQRFTVEV